MSADVDAANSFKYVCKKKLAENDYDLDFVCDNFKRTNIPGV